MQGKSALLIIDVQRGYINKYTKDLPRLAEEAQVGYDLVWAARLEYEDNSPFLTIRRRSGFSEVDNPTKLAFDVRPDARVIVKHGYSAANEGLLDDLKKNMIKEIDLMGMDTDQCVLATAFTLFDAGITPRIIANNCASTSGIEMHKLALNVMKHALGEHNILYS